MTTSTYVSWQMYKWLTVVNYISGSVVAHHVSSRLRSSTQEGCTVTWTKRTMKLSRLAGNQLYYSVSVSGGLKFLTRKFGWARASREVAQRPVGILTKLSSETWRLEIKAPWLRRTCFKGWIVDQNRVQGGENMIVELWRPWKKLRTMSCFCSSRPVSYRVRLIVLWQTQVFLQAHSRPQPLHVALTFASACSCQASVRLGSSFLV